MRKVLWLFFLSSCLWDGPGHDLRGVDTRLTILHTGDIHSRLLPYHLSPNASDRDMGLNEANGPFGGASRLGYLIRRERARSGRVLHVDSGDSFQGAPIFNENLGEAELRFLSWIGLDAMTVGNHEFDAGASNFAQKLNDFAPFDVLAANYAFADPNNINNNDLAHHVRPYAIYNIDGLKIGVIGMGNFSSLTSVGEGGNSLQITPLQQNEALRSYVQFLRPSVDLIIMVSHLGIEDDVAVIAGYERDTLIDRVAPNWQIVRTHEDGTVTVFIPGVPGIDLIVGGHNHQVTNPPKVVVGVDGRNVVIMHSGAFAKYLGRLDVVLQDDPQRGGKQIVSHKYQMLPVDQRLAPYEDQQITQLLEPYILDLNQNLDLQKIIGYAPKTITRTSETGNGDSGIGNLVAESMRKRRRVEAEFAMTNTLGIRDNMYRGPVTFEAMFNMFPFENSITTMYLSGSEIQETLNFVANKSTGRGCNSQVQVAGLSFTINCAQALANAKSATQLKDAAQNIAINGKPLEKNTIYKAAVNDYIAAGGSGFKVLKRNTTKYNTQVSLRDSLIDYIRTLPTCGTYEKTTAHYCDANDAFSQEICEQLGDVGRIPNNPHAKGPYADFPCIVSFEDGRITRQLSDDLVTVQIDDAGDWDDEVQP
jgi:5'-nucleotidase / UDP-sugar diphosphatase